MKKVIKKHPLALRWFHWVNFPLLGVMIWSGMLIYWANDIYKISWGDKTLLQFFPDSFYKALNIPFRLAEGMRIHFVFMWLFAINGFIYVLYLLFSKEWKYIFPNIRSFKEAGMVVLNDLHLSKKRPPQKKYNAAQKIAYTLVIIMGLGSVLTGLSIYKPVQFGTLTNLVGGYEWARIEHFTLTILFSLFFVIHIVQVILAGWNNFQSMVTGLFVVKKKEIIPAMIPAKEEIPDEEIIIPQMPSPIKDDKVENVENVENDIPEPNEKEEDEII